MRFTKVSGVFLTSIRWFFNSKIGSYKKELEKLSKESREYQVIMEQIKKLSELRDKYVKILSSYTIYSNEKIIYNGNEYVRYEELRRLTELQIEALNELKHSGVCDDFPKYIISAEKNYINVLEEYLLYLKNNVLFAV